MASVVAPAEFTCRGISASKRPDAISGAASPVDAIDQRRELGQRLAVDQSGTVGPG